MDLDLDINNYTNDELFNLLQLQNNVNDKQVRDSISSTIQLLENSIDNKNERNEYELFFYKVQDVLLEELRKNTLLGAGLGVVFFGAYAAVECFFLSIVPWVLMPDHNYTPVHRGRTSFLFLIFYPVIGFVVGALSGVAYFTVVKKVRLIDKVPKSFFLSIWMAFSLVFLFSINPRKRLSSC